MASKKAAKEEKLGLNDLYVIFAGMRGVRRGTIEALYKAGYTSLEKIASSSVEELTKVKGVGERVAEKLIERAKEYLGETSGGLKEVLEGIPRLRREAMEEILKRYSSVEALRRASVEDLMEIKGIGRALAVKIIESVGGEVKETAGVKRGRGMKLEEFLEALGGMRGIRKSTIEAIYKAGYNTPEKVASATVEELTEIKNVGPKAAVRIRERALELVGKGKPPEEKAEEVPVEKEVEEINIADILSSIPRLRKSTVDEILQRYPDLHSLKGATKEELMEIKGVGESTAEKIIETVSKIEAPKREEETAEEKPKEKKPGALDGILKSFKGIAQKIKGIFFPEKKRIKEETKQENKEDGGENVERKIERFEDIEGVSEEIAKKLREGGYRNIEELREATVEDLIMIEGIDEELARKILNSI
ncbi:MAG: hypothetical protein DRJ64_08930 [Thermoprotei archaeon]|nr:MAG: hypothetical protein DRJ64_08930 [Thermoprotei archaeon]